MSKETLLHLEDYWNFVIQYQADPLGFAVSVCGMLPSGDQEDLLLHISPDNAKVSVVSGTGCFAKGTMIMRSNGDAVAVEDIRVGDRLMGPDGDSVRNVLELKRGRESMYRLSYSDGSSHIFNESHILTLAPGAKYISRGKPDIVNITVREWLKWPKTKRERYYAYRSPVRNFDRHQEYLPVPPYIMGIWLGDGSQHKPEITTADIEIDEAFSSYAESLGCSITKRQNSEKSWCVYAGRALGTGKSNPVTKLLRSSGVFRNKHIPDIYKFASFEDRLELLAGLIDTDGSFDAGSGMFEFSQKCGQMANDVAWIARSIGCHAVAKQTRKTCCNNGKTDNYWRVMIGRNIDRIPVRVKRLRGKGSNCTRRSLIYSIKSAEPLGDGDYYGFVLDGDNRFLGHDFTVLHNTGKTAVFARIAIWHLLCFPVAFYEGKVEIGSNTYIGAPRISQVADGVWKEMNDVRIAIANGPFAWLNDYYEITKTRVAVKGFEDQWFITQVAMQQGQSIGVAGKHRYFQLIVIDEGAGVSDDHFDVIEGTQTQPGNRTLMASQGVRNAGRFYESHHNLSRANGGSWAVLRFSSEASPFVTKQWLKDRENETGGRDSIEYRIRVLGEFAEDSGSNLLSRSELDKAFSNGQIIDDDEPYGLIVAADVGLGEYRDESVAIIAKVVGYSDHGVDARRVEYIEMPYCTNSKNEIIFAGDLANLVGKLSNATLMVDNGGVGATVNKLIEASGVPVVKVNWGKPCFKKEYRERFYNQRACAMVRFRDAIKTGRVSFRMNIDKRAKEKILLQGARLPYHFAEAGGLRYVMEKKEIMRKNGIKSPDIIDAMSFCFLEDAQYIASESVANKNHIVSSVIKEADKMFADIV